MPKYLIAPFVGYLVGGGLKFAINSVRARRLAFSSVGLGGIPSTHSTIVATVASLVGFDAGLDSPAFGAAITLVFITTIDAMDLRQKVGLHARAIRRHHGDDTETQRIRERIGHTPVEVAAAGLVGVLCGYALAAL